MGVLPMVYLPTTQQKIYSASLHPNLHYFLDINRPVQSSLESTDASDLNNSQEQGVIQCAVKKCTPLLLQACCLQCLDCMKLNNHSLFPACLPTFRDVTDLYLSLIINRSIQTIPRQTITRQRYLQIQGSTSSRSVSFMGISLCNVAICTDLMQHPSAGVYLSPASAQGADGDGP